MSQTQRRGVAPPRTPRLYGRWLSIGRATWLLATVTILALNIVSVPFALREAQTVCSGNNCSAYAITQLTPTQAQQLAAVGLSLRFYSVYSVTIALTGLLISYALAVALFWLRSDERMALFAAFMFVLLGGSAAFGTLQALPFASPKWAVPVAAVNAIGQSAFYVFLCVFPSGRFVPRWLRWPAAVYAAIWLGSLALAPALNPLNHASATFLAFFALVLSCQVYRYLAASTHDERQTTKWAVFGITLGVGGFTLLLFVGNMLLPESVRDSVEGATFREHHIECTPVAHSHFHWDRHSALAAVGH